MLKNVEEPVLVLFDSEEEYAYLMSDYLKAQKGLPWKIRSYTSESSLMNCEKDNHISMLLISESSYRENIKELDAERIVILNESGFEDDSFISVSKYQAAECVLHSLLELYIEVSTEIRKEINGSHVTNFIGIYSPIKRSLQTSFALAMSELLSDTARTLYVSFEHYSGVADIMPGDKDTDLADLIYFLNADADKFKLHFQSIVRQKGSHIKMTDALTITPGDIEGCTGRYISKRTGKQMLFTMTEAQSRAVTSHINYYHIKNTEPIIRRKKRVLQDAFKDLREEIGIEGTLIDVYYAGLKYYTETERPRKI